MITKLLVANRGEIARRIFRTCHEMGIATVAVYSDPDAMAPFARDADEAIPLGGASASESYLRADAIIAAALKVGADAIHPGYGFLSENAGFAKRCADAGLIFVGPTVEAIERMGSKIIARTIMEGAGVPVLPGADLTGVADDKIAALADDVGWPVLVKASYGGGGRGMRVVREPEHLAEAIASARREAGAAFGNDTVFLEHYVDEPRHVEIQIFGDGEGTIVHLGERECSIQRRHQKVVEESPSPVVDDALRSRMGDAAIKAGKALGYLGAGTVEFLLAPNGEFYFLEVNTRLQVEHPVTELVTGLDLVRLQLEVASGAPLSDAARDVTMSGHAIEVRLCAEDPANDFLPAAGYLRTFELADVPGIRVDSGVESGDTVSTNYDSMLAKVIAYAPTRQEAADRLAGALAGARINGVVTNRDLLVGILRHPDFAAGKIDTHFLDRVSVVELLAEPSDAEVRVAVVAAAFAEQTAERTGAAVLATAPSGFRTNASQLQRRSYILGGVRHDVGYALGRNQRVEVDGAPVDVALLASKSNVVDAVIDGVRRSIWVESVGGTVHVGWARRALALEAVPRFPSHVDEPPAGSLVAPMPGTIIRVLVGVGEVVVKGQALVVVEAMKMEHTITAISASTVTSIPVQEGGPVGSGQVVIVLDAEEEGTDEH